MFSSYSTLRSKSKDDSNHRGILGVIVDFYTFMTKKTVELQKKIYKKIIDPAYNGFMLFFRKDSIKITRDWVKMLKLSLKKALKDYPYLEDFIITFYMQVSLNAIEYNELFSMYEYEGEEQFYHVALCIGKFLLEACIHALLLGYPNAVFIPLFSGLAKYVFTAFKRVRAEKLYDLIKMLSIFGWARCIYKNITLFFCKRLPQKSSTHQESHKSVYALLIVFGNCFVVETWIKPFLGDVCFLLFKQHPVSSALFFVFYGIGFFWLSSISSIFIEYFLEPIGLLFRCLASLPVFDVAIKCLDFFVSSLCFLLFAEKYEGFGYVASQEISANNMPRGVDGSLHPAEKSTEEFDDHMPPSWKRS